MISATRPESMFPACSQPALLDVTPHALPLKQANSFKGLWLEVDKY